MLWLYANMFFSVIYFTSQGHLYLSRKDGKNFSIEFTLLKNIFTPFFAPVSCHIIVTGHNT